MNIQCSFDNLTLDLYQYKEKMKTISYTLLQCVYSRFRDVFIFLSVKL